MGCGRWRGGVSAWRSFARLAERSARSAPQAVPLRSSCSGRPEAASFGADAAYGYRPMNALNSTPRGSVLTANRLADGAVVFLDFEGDWSDNLAAALVARAPDERRALVDRARYEAERALVVEPHLVDVDELDGRLIPIRRRGTGRTEGRSAFADPGGARAASPLAWRAAP